MTDALGNTTVLDYEDGCGCGAPKRVIHPDGAVRSFEYNRFGLVTRLTDEEGNVTSYAYDARGLLRSTTDALGRVVYFEYDAAGNRTLVRDPLGNETRSRYDAAGRVVEEIDPLGQSTRYTYDPAGNLVEEIDRSGRITRYAYDRANRPIEETWYTRDGVLVHTIITTYDAARNRLTATDPDSTLTFSYDALGRVETTSNAGTPGTPTVVLTYTYDAAGNVVSVVDNQGVRADSTYDGRNLLVDRTWQGAGLDGVRIAFRYNATGRRTGIDRYDDLGGTQPTGSTAIDYNKHGLTESITHTNALDAVLADFEYTYDRLGLVQTFHDTGRAVEYDYDAIGQLVGANHADDAPQPDERYVYDANGNRIESHLHGTGYLTGPGNQLLSDGTYRYGYDLEGNLDRRTEIATGAVTAFEYDHRNRLVRVEERDAGGTLLGAVRFVYDVDGRRIAKVVDGGTTVHTVYDGVNAWADFDMTGDVADRYLFGDEVDELLARQKAGEGAVWYLTDRLGTVRDLTDVQGNPVNRVEYDSFGNVVAQTSPAAGDRYLYTGRELDPVTGLFFYRARYYDPSIGLFISQDPIGFEGGDFNLQRYVRNSPTNGSDPTGNLTIVEKAVLAGAISFVAGQALGIRCLANGGDGYDFLRINFMTPAIVIVGVLLGVSNRGIQNTVIDSFPDCLGFD